MGRGRSLRILFVLGVLLFLLPVTAQAYFIIEFTDGTHITVSNYKEVGKTIKIHTQEGWFAFRKEDVAKIIDTNPNKGVRNLDVPADTKLTLPSEIKKKAEDQQQLALEQEQVQQKKTPLEEIRTRPTLSLLQEALSYLTGIPDMHDLFHRAKGMLFGLRYIFALLLGVKVLKIFLAASTR